MIDAIILAGSPNDGPLQKCSEVQFEALIPIHGRIMVDYVVAALKDCPSVNNIIVVGPSRELAGLADPPRVTLVPAGATAIDSMIAGMDGTVTEEVLIVTSDVPLLTSKAVEGFLTECTRWPADFYYPIVSKVINQSRFPNVQRTYVKLQEGTYTGGNLFLVNKSILDRGLAKAREVVDLRKSPWRLCRLLGVNFLIKFLLKKLTIHELEQQVSSIFRIKAKAVVVPYPEIGIDVDKPSDLSLVKHVLRELS